MIFYACGLKSLPALKPILYRAALVASRIQRVKIKNRKTQHQPIQKALLSKPLVLEQNT